MFPLSDLELVTQVDRQRAMCLCGESVEECQAHIFLPEILFQSTQQNLTRRETWPNQRRPVPFDACATAPPADCHWMEAEDDYMM